MTTLLFIPGSLRAASSARATTRSLVERLPDGVNAIVADPGILPHYNADLTDDPNVVAFVDQVATADGVVFVTPEYISAYPAF